MRDEPGGPGAPGGAPGPPGPPPRQAREVPPSIAAVIAAEGGRVPFSRFMELALLDPEAGYYRRGGGQVGRAGDFVTVPSRVPLFNTAMAALLADVVDALADETDGGRSGKGCVHVIEIGGGRGEMSAGILEAWQRTRPDLASYVTWTMVEPGPTLSDMQWDAVRGAVRAGWRVGRQSDRVYLPAGPRVIVTNELIDALPVHIVDVSGDDLWERGVELDATGTVLKEVHLPPRPETCRELEFLFGTVEASRLRGYTQDGTIELRPAAEVFLASVASGESSACVVTVDYGGWPVRPGFPDGDEAYRRTVRAYLRHERRQELLRYVGRQDLTADVDFGALAAHGRSVGLECLLYTPLASLLAAAGGGHEVERIRQAGSPSLEDDIMASWLECLLDPADLGGLFKVMVQVREGPYRADEDSNVCA